MSVDQRVGAQVNALNSNLWLLDTNIISDLMKYPSGRAASQLRLLGQSKPDATIVTSVVVDCEIRYGLEKNRAVKLAAAYAHVKASLDVLALDEAVALHYGELRSQLERNGTPIGPNDMLIAAHALALNATLVTDNDAEFKRVEALRVVNWLAS